VSSKSRTTRSGPFPRWSRCLLAVIAACGFALVSVSGAGAVRPPRHEPLPVLFVHGFESAGSNFASQEMRFESNGYPHTWLDAIDYNSPAAIASSTEVDQQIEEAIAMLKQQSGRSQVDIVAHSEGTSVVYNYLTQGPQAAARRASVAAYANIDGQEKNPGVPTLALWAGRCGDLTCSKPERSIEGAENVTIPNATHVQTSTSAESFQHMFEFFTGRMPFVDILPQPGLIALAGKALEFPENKGLAGDTLEIWPLDFNGQRIGKRPLAVSAITNGATGGGEWGPVVAISGQRYEFALKQPGRTLHTYYEPFVRSDYDVRLLGSNTIEALTGRFPGSSGASITRYKEFWGNQPGENDELLVNGLELCTATLCPWEKEINAYFAFNWEGKQESTLSQEPILSSLPFIQAAQVYIPASEPPNAAVSYQLRSRGGGPKRTLNVPNWEGTTNSVQIFWNDFDRLDF
jgi:hypothetical protein